MSAVSLPPSSPLSQMFLYNHAGQRGIGISIGGELALPWGPHEAGLGARWAAWGSGGSWPGAWDSTLGAEG